uniref:Si:dkey-29b11.3 n=1 Tax=Oncorhynchus kisutch TaxID=8019 RepID=A0A8C7F2P0_ONCKI
MENNDAPIEFNDDRTVCVTSVKGLKENWQRWSNKPVVTVEFGKLFEHYVNISNKVVGILLRARKQGLVSFEGEMLWQGQDDRVLITLLQ